MCLSGRAVPELSWQVGIQHPLERLKVAAVVEANELAVATSGAYARGAHSVDPYKRPGVGGRAIRHGHRPRARNRRRVCDRGLAMGPHFGPPWTARLRGYEAMTILANGTVLSTGGFPAV
jgi:thiamine biosynthesis lipoprotein